MATDHTQPTTFLGGTEFAGVSSTMAKHGLPSQMARAAGGRLTEDQWMRLVGQGWSLVGVEDNDSVVLAANMPSGIVIKDKVQCEGRLYRTLKEEWTKRQKVEEYLNAWVELALQQRRKAKGKQGDTGKEGGMLDLGNVALIYKDPLQPAKKRAARKAFGTKIATNTRKPSNQ